MYSVIIVLFNLQHLCNKNKYLSCYLRLKMIEISNGSSCRY